MAINLAFTHKLEAAKGWSDRRSPLQTVAKISSNVQFDLPVGRVVHLNSSGEYETGVASKQMPLFLLRGATSLDVKNEGLTPEGAFVQQPILPSGTAVTALVATGGYELATTEFDTNQTYAPNDLLVAPVDNTNSAVGGVLTNQGTGTAGAVQLYGADAVVGVVSRGVRKNHHRSYDQNVPKLLYFWPVYLPSTS